MDRRQFMECLGALSLATTTPEVVFRWFESQADIVVEQVSALISFLDKDGRTLACGTARCPEPASKGMIRLSDITIYCDQTGIVTAFVVEASGGFRCEVPVVRGSSADDKTGKIVLTDTYVILGDRIDLFGVVVSLNRG